MPGYVSSDPARTRYDYKVGFGLCVGGQALPTDGMVASEYNELNKGVLADEALQSIKIAHWDDFLK